MRVSGKCPIRSDASEAQARVSPSQPKLHISIPFLNRSPSRNCVSNKVKLASTHQSIKRARCLAQAPHSISSPVSSLHSPHLSLPDTARIESQITALQGDPRATAEPRSQRTRDTYKVAGDASCRAAPAHFPPLAPGRSKSATAAAAGTACPHRGSSCSLPEALALPAAGLLYTLQHYIGVPS